MATLSATYGANPVDNDADEHSFTADINENVGYALDDMPGDFGTMDDTAFTVHAEARYSGTITDDVVRLKMLIENAAGTAILAGLVSGSPASGSAPELADSSTNLTGTLTEFSFDLSGASGYVDTTANKTTWDGAVIRLYQVSNKTKSPDGLAIHVSKAWITGNYTTGGAGGVVVRRTPHRNLLVR